MTRLLCWLCALCLAAGCSPRGTIEFAEPAEGAAQHRLWVASLRPTEPAGPEQRVPPRPEDLAYGFYDVSVPPGHVTGNVEWPEATPDAATDFVTLRGGRFTDAARFARHVAQADPGPRAETILFVHGFNMTHGESVYQLAQVVHDFELTAPAVLFSWPSAGVAAGYLYDRDSVLFARDALEEVILALTRHPERRIVLMGHSMGNLLIVETLRQLALSGRFDVKARIDALFMIAPDIDGELFRAQVSRIPELPDPSVIVAAGQDRALRLSALLTGKQARLGSQTDRETVADLPISVVDVSDLSTGGMSHDIALSSPAAIAILKKLNVNNLPGEIRVEPLVDLGGLLGLDALVQAPYP